MGKMLSYTLDSMLSHENRSRPIGALTSCQRVRHCEIGKIR